MVSPILTATISFGCIVSLLSMGLVLVWTRTGVCNFAAVDFATIAIYMSLIAVQLWGWGIYASLLLGVPLSGLTALGVWFIVIKPLKERGATSEELMIATLGLSLFIGSVFSIIADTLVTATEIQRAFGFTFSASFASTVTVLTFLGAFGFLHILFTRTDIGIAMKAVGYNANLAESVGVNTQNIYRLTWFVAGALAGFAGPLYAIQYRVFPTLGATTLIVTVFASVILGGTKGIYDAVAGSWIIAFGQVELINFLAIHVIGSGILPYAITVPLILLVIVLLFFPGGLVRIEWKRYVETLKGYVKGGVTE